MFRIPSICLMAALLLSACAGTPPNPNPAAALPQQTAAYVDLDRFLGRWYVIANIPYFAERGKVRAYVEYSRGEDGLLNDFYWSAEDFIEPLSLKRGVARVVDTQTNARWEVSFLRPVWADYLILYVDPEYRYAVIGHPSRNYAWIFSREARMTDERYEQLLSVLEAQGYDIRRVLKVPQVADQEGAPGFQ